MRAIKSETDLYGSPLLLPILNMFDGDGEETACVEYAESFVILLGNNESMIVQAPAWRIVDTKAN